MRMGTIRRFEELECWKTSRNLCKKVFEITLNERFAKDFKFINQIRDSSGSGMDNIAEGFDRGGNREFIQFLFIAKGSIGETKSQLYRALDRDYVSDEVFKETFEIADTASKQIARLANYLLNSEEKGLKFK